MKNYLLGLLRPSKSMTGLGDLVVVSGSAKEDSGSSLGSLAALLMLCLLAFLSLFLLFLLVKVSLSLLERFFDVPFNWISSLNLIFSGFALLDCTSSGVGFGEGLMLFLQLRIEVKCLENLRNDYSGEVYLSNSCLCR